MLSDPQKRDLYDRLGEEGLKNGGGMGGMGGMGGGAHFRSPEDLFAEIFGGGGFGGFGGGGGDPFGAFGGMGGMGGGGGGHPFMGGMGGGHPFGGGGGRGPQAPRKDPPIEVKLKCSLEELYSGCVKKMRIGRATASGQRVEEILEIDVKPGWKAQTKVRFPEKGDERPGRVPADIVFVVEERPHETFRRDGNDLVMTAHVSLADALCGGQLAVKTLDGRTLEVPLTSVITPGSARIIR